MGNLNEQNFNEIWNGKAYKELRVRINSDDPPEYCKTCHSIDLQDVDDIKSHIKI